MREVFDAIGLPPFFWHQGLEKTLERYCSRLFLGAPSKIILVAKNNSEKPLFLMPQDPDD